MPRCELFKLCLGSPQQDKTLRPFSLVESDVSRTRLFDGIAFIWRHNEAKKYMPNTDLPLDLLCTGRYVTVLDNP